MLTKKKMNRIIWETRRSFARSAGKGNMPEFWRNKGKLEALEFVRELMVWRSEARPIMTSTKVCPFGVLGPATLCTDGTPGYTREGPTTIPCRAWTGDSCLLLTIRRVVIQSEPWRGGYSCRSGEDDTDAGWNGSLPGNGTRHYYGGGIGED